MGMQATASPFFAFSEECGGRNASAFAGAAATATFPGLSQNREARDE